MKDKLSKQSKEYFEKVSKVKVGEPFIDEGVFKGVHQGGGWLSGHWQCNRCMRMVPATQSGCGCSMPMKKVTAARSV